MKYMLLVYLDEHGLSEEERETCYGDSAGLAQELDREGVYLDASPLHLTDSARSVRVRKGRATVTDGPFAETHEQLGGYYLVDVPDENAAIRIAERIPVATVGTIEVRPVMEIGGLPDGL